MTKVICTTTINPPTEALIKFAAMEDWQLVIAGDLKTPEKQYCDHHSDRCFYLSPSLQESFDHALSRAIDWNCIQRRNFAFLFACKELKADIIATVDDDNIPKENWGKNVNVGKEVKCNEHQLDIPAFDPLSVTKHHALWHRGFPLQLTKTDWTYRTVEIDKSVKCDVQADLWDGDADVDAFCRWIMDSSNCNFGDIKKLYTSNKPSPFNSQNTFLSREVMPHYFMFPDVGRMDDIFASYHVQAHGFRVLYGPPTVVQKRNEHDVISDLLNEVEGIKHNLAIVKEVPTNKNAVLDRLPPRALEAFRLYQKHFE